MIYTVGLEKKGVLPERPKFSFAEPESVRVRKIAVLSVLRLNGRKILHVGNAETKLL